LFHNDRELKVREVNQSKKDQNENERKERLDELEKETSVVKTRRSKKTVKGTGLQRAVSRHITASWFFLLRWSMSRRRRNEEVLIDTHSLLQCIMIPG
jgi:hypothetical protein